MRPLLFCTLICLVFPYSTVAEPKPVTFVAYNLKNYLPLQRSVNGKLTPNAPKPEEEIAEVINLLSAAKPDILGLCEIGGIDDAVDLQKRLKSKGITLEHVEIIGGGDPDRKMAVISRFPIKLRNSKSELTYKIGGQTMPVQRGILDVVVEINSNYDLRLVGVHLKSKREVPNADQSLMRRNEAAIVRRHASEILEKDPDTNLLVYGDFNATRNEKPVREIVGRYRTPEYLTPLRLKDEADQTWTHFWDDADVYARIDFICASRGILPEIDRSGSYIASSADWYTASDHRPLVLKIQPKN